jgi:hypothetical protein
MPPGYSGGMLILKGIDTVIIGRSDKGSQILNKISVEGYNTCLDVYANNSRRNAKITPILKRF